MKVLTIALIAGLSAGPACACDRAAFRVVLDVGHTDRAPGAISARGVSELEFNRKLSAIVAARLILDGFAVTMIEGRGVGRADLLDRAARASALHPGAFLSLHHDSVQRRYIEPWTAQDGTRRMHSEHASGFSLFVSRRNGEPARSLTFARVLGSALIARGLHASSHHAEAIRGEGRPWADKENGVYAFDDLVVLKHTAAPAALLENGLIISKDEEAILTSSERRERVSAAISEALVRFCDAR